MEKYKNTIKLSTLLLQALCKLKHQKLLQIQNSLHEFCQKYGEINKDCHLFDLAVGKNWLNGAGRIVSRTQRNIEVFSYFLQKSKEAIRIDESELPKLSDIFAEMLQLVDEFGEYQFDLKERTISVITEPVTLEEIPLGPFEIKLYIDQIHKINTDSPYRVRALQPNPAGSDDCVTHPHVSSERLCEGDGHVAIVTSLQQGRLCDFFTMIVSILNTYNPDSPYVRLDEWEGVTCYDCGCGISSGDSYYCEYCERDFCAQCSTYCQRCDTTVCMGCSYECPSCNEPVCQNCVAKCNDCQETFCKDCLGEEDLCQNCQEQRKEAENEEQEQLTEEPKADLEIQPDSLGQTGIHA